MVQGIGKRLAYKPVVDAGRVKWKAEMGDERRFLEK